VKKRRVTLNLDEDVVEALQTGGGRSLSAVANAALRQALAMEAHRRALLRWLDRLNSEYGAPTAAELAAADALLDAVERGEVGETSVA
jgi:Arc/MetJ-type ribon-helix-helix transcriptional regulator